MGKKAPAASTAADYPWGDSWTATNAATISTAGQETTAPVWAHPEGASPWGCYQMAGNVWEWCEDWYDNMAYSRFASGDFASAQNGVRRVCRGGAWNGSAPQDFRCCHRLFNQGRDPEHRFPFQGFRCARNEVPPPAPP